MENKLYAFAGDFHEDAEALDKFLVAHKEDQIVLLGDFFDSYGGDTQGMLTVLEGLLKGDYNLNYEPVVIRGNHDDFIIQTANRDSFAFDTWMINGGKKTLRNMGYKGSVHNLEHVARFLNSDMAWLMNFLDKTVYSWETDNIYAVHGGLDWELVDPRDTPNDEKTWARDYYLGDLTHNKPHHNDLGKVIVSGHTPVQNYTTGDISIIEMKADENDVPRYLIDGGAKSGAEGHVLELVLDEAGKVVARSKYYN